MRTQQRQIEDMLADEGWLVIEREHPTEWWLDEIWTLESGWNPVGARAYVGFLVDPQSPSDRASGEHVWAVFVTGEIPTGRAGMGGEVPLRPNWEKVRRAEVLAQIRDLRRSMRAG
jgi:hypothetical protein